MQESVLDLMVAEAIDSFDKLPERSPGQPKTVPELQLYLDCEPNSTGKVKRTEDNLLLPALEIELGDLFADQTDEPAVSNIEDFFLSSWCDEEQDSFISNSEIEDVYSKLTRLLEYMRVTPVVTK